MSRSLLLRTARAAARPLLRRSWACAALLGLALGASCRPEGALDLRQLGRLSISCDQTDALIFVDDHHVGTVAALRGRPLAMRPGARRLELRREGFFSYYRDLQVVRGQHERLAVKLRKTPF